MNFGAVELSGVFANIVSAAVDVAGADAGAVAVAGVVAGAKNKSGRRKVRLLPDLPCFRPCPIANISATAFTVEGTDADAEAGADACAGVDDCGNAKNKAGRRKVRLFLSLPRFCI